MSNASAQNALQIDALIEYWQDGVIKAPTIEVTEDVTLWLASECVIREDGVQAIKDASNYIAWSAEHVTSANKWGGGIVQANRAGASMSLGTKVPGATQTTPMAYDAEALLDEALDALEADAGNIIIGRWKILNNAGDHTAGVDDLIADSDITSIAFETVAEKVLPTPL